jgi:hypothetical protein
MNLHFRVLHNFQTGCVVPAFAIRNGSAKEIGAQPRNRKLPMNHPSFANGGFESQIGNNPDVSLEFVNLGSAPTG